MKNYINYHIDLSKVPNDIKTTFYLDDDLVENNIIIKDNKEPLVKIEENNKNIKIAPFWKDNIDFDINDKELKYLLDLESIILGKYINSNPDFGIFVRESVYNKLLDVNNSLKQKGFELIIKIGYRPLEVQEQLFNSIYNYFQEKNKHLSKDELYKLACQYVSDGSKYTSPHSTGGAVDVELAFLDGDILDMGAPINYPGDKSNITYDNLSNDQKNNRFLLLNEMLDKGFANLSSEWWHFSYGDPIWAYFYGKKESLYSSM